MFFFPPQVTLFNRRAGTEGKVNKETRVSQSKELIEKLLSLKIKVVSIKTKLIKIINANEQAAIQWRKLWRFMGFLLVT